MAKKHTSCYLAGQRSSSWQKIKPVLIVPCVIIGYQAGRSGVQRLCVAAVREEGLRYVNLRVASRLPRPWNWPNGWPPCDGRGP